MTRMGLAGMARELAANCELTYLDDARAELRLARNHRHLLTKVAEDRIQAAFSSTLGAVRVTISVSGEIGETPAQIKTKTRQASLAMAVDAIEGDPVVRDLIENFDATLLQNSIRPLAD